MSNFTNHPPNDDTSVFDLMQRFPDEASAIGYFESIRWKNGPVCPHCGNDVPYTFWEIAPDKENKIRVGLRQCKACKKQFRVTVGTIFEDSHIPLNQWLVAWYLFAGAKKSISAKQMQRHLGIGSYKTAWFMCHRMRHAMSDAGLRKLHGIVEVDETYVGGKSRGRGHQFGVDNKTPVVSLVERKEGGQKKSFVMPHVTAKNLKQAIRDNVEPGTAINTDEFQAYKGVGKEFPHETVCHSKKQYVRRFKDGHKVTTNTVEGSFGLLKRGIVGQFHHVSKKHLHRYVDEFDYRWNTRDKTDGERMAHGLGKTPGKRLTYKPVKDPIPPNPLVH